MNQASKLDSLHMNTTEIAGTPFYDRTSRLNNTHMRYVPWDIYHVVDIYTSVHDELKNLREAVTINDMSPLGKFSVKGPDAVQFVDYLITKDATKIEVSQGVWTAWCDHNGKVIADGMVFRIEEDHFRFTGDPSYNWFMQNRGDFNVEIEDITHDYGMLSLQGPKSKDVVEALLDGQDVDLKFSRLRTATIGGADIELSRQGFTGEHGYEFTVTKDDALAVWDAIVEAGEAHGIKPCGWLAADVARVESGLVIPGPDYTNGGGADVCGAAIKLDEENMMSPFECRMGRAVDLDKEGDFIGKDVLIKEKENGTKRNMVGLRIDWREIAELYTRQDIPPQVLATSIWVSLRVAKNDQIIGRATSTVYSPLAKSVVSLGFLENEYCVPGTQVSVEFEVGELTEFVNAEVVKLPFFELNRAK